jgi:sugar lactone lactonase YvrE
MNANLVDTATGSPSRVMTSSPNGGQTTALGVTESLANLLASAIRNPSTFLKPLLDLATPEGEPRPNNTITALANIARWPANNAAGIYTQAKVAGCYGAGVQQQPVAWTVVVKVNKSGDDSRMFGGPANVAFDSRGRAWIANNVKQGGPDSAPYCMVLDRAGHPALDDDGNLMTPFDGGGLLGAGFGVTVDAQQRIWIGDFGWTTATTPAGSVSLFDPNAKALSPAPDGFIAGVQRVQQVAIDAGGNVWMASYGNQAVVVYPGAGNSASNPDRYYSYTGNTNFQPFGIAIAADQTAWVTNSNKDASSVVHLRFTGSSIVKMSETPAGQVLKGIVVDSNRNVWAASGGNDTVYRFDENGNLLGAYEGGGVEGPWGLCLDGNDDVWVANFGPLRPGVFEGRLSQLAGTKQSSPGTPLTPEGGYLLPTAGDPVLLANGDPLYGPNQPPCTTPMMRTTGVTVDAAGNVWSCNNWKPDFVVDTGDPKSGTEGNPGGDGILIWIGVAKPVTY